MIVRHAIGPQDRAGGVVCVLAYIGLLYQVEREAREGKLDAGERFALPQAKSRPILDDLKAYLEAERIKVLPKSPVGEAINYAMVQAAHLRHRYHAPHFGWLNRSWLGRVLPQRKMRPRSVIVVEI